MNNLSALNKKIKLIEAKLKALRSEKHSIEREAFLEAQAAHYGRRLQKGDVVVPNDPNSKIGDIVVINPAEFYGCWHVLSRPSVYFSKAHYHKWRLK